jgi:hypothetical protein
MSTTIKAAEAISAKNAARQSGPAQPSTVVNACWTLRSWPGADAAMAADSPITIDAQNSRTESIVRLFLRPGSVWIKTPTRQDLMPARPRRIEVGPYNGRCAEYPGVGFP